jgi:hypothetical protein
MVSVGLVESEELARSAFKKNSRGIWLLSA